MQQYQPKSTFEKEHGSTVAQPLDLEGRCMCNFDTDKNKISSNTEMKNA